MAIIWAMGESFRRMDSLDLLYCGIGQVFKTIIYIIGVTWFLAELASALSLFLESNWDLKYKCNHLQQIYFKHPFIFVFIGLLLCLTPNLVLSYPASMCPDVWYQLLQYFGQTTFTAHHPPTHTFFVGVAENLGQFLGSGNLGLFFYIGVQTMLFAFILSYMLNTMRKLSAPIWLRLLTFFIAIFSPYYTQYIGLILKDNIYTYFIMLFIIELTYMLILKKDCWINKKHLFLLSISMIGSILFRNNGKYIIYPMIIIITILLIVQNRKKCYKKIYLSALILFIISIGVSSGIQMALVQHYQIEEGSIREALSLPFQQTARYAKEHGAEISLEEKEAINAILSYDILAERYDPKISDPIKETYKEDSSIQDLVNYFKVWAQQGMKHPLTYIEATINQNYYLVYPLIEDTTTYNTTIIDNETNIQLARELNIHEIPIIQKIDNWRTGFNKVLFSLPILGLLSNIGFYNLILIYLCYSSTKKRIYEMVVVLMPLLLSNVVIVLAPVIMGHPRYAFPIIYSMPLVLSVFLFFSKQDKSRFLNQGKCLISEHQMIISELK